MKIEAITLMAALGGMALQAAPGAGVPADRKLTVCMEGMPDLTVTGNARRMASEIFAGIGVKVEWRVGLDRCPSQAIQIKVGTHTPDDLKPGALAHAFPYEGTHIQVFYDRILAGYARSLVPTVLAHVLAHEIAHILQGVSRHSSSGVLKARWDAGDLARMTRKPLEFTAEDINLIRDGLAGRAGRNLVAMRTAQGPIAADAVAVR